MSRRISLRCNTIQTALVSGLVVLPFRPGGAFPADVPADMPVVGRNPLREWVIQELAFPSFWPGRALKSVVAQCVSTSCAVTCRYAPWWCSRVPKWPFEMWSLPWDFKRCCCAATHFARAVSPDSAWSANFGKKFVRVEIAKVVVPQQVPCFPSYQNWGGV